MLFLRSLLFNILFFVGTWLLALFGLPILLASEEKACAVPRIWANSSVFLLRVICNIRMEIRGAEHITQGGVIYACKHQSAWDTLAMWIVLRRPIYILKQELLKIPLYGRYLTKTGNIAIDRAGGVSSLKIMIEKAAEHLRQRHSLVIYPEGTRRPPGAPPAYHTGIAAMYSQLKVPVVPVALNAGKFWGRNAFIKRPGTIVIEFLPPIPPGMKGREFMQVLETTIETASNKLL